MDRENSVIGQDERDHLEHVPGLIRPNDQLLRRVAIRLEIDNDERVSRSMPDGAVADAVPSSRMMDLHTPLV